FVKSPTPRQQAQLRSLDEQLSAARAAVARLEPELAAAQARWEKALDPNATIPWSFAEGLMARFALDGKDGPGEFREGAPRFVQGKTGQAASFDGQLYFDAGDVADVGFRDKFSFGAWIHPTGPRGGTVLSRMEDNDRAEGYGLTLVDGKLLLHFAKRWLDDALRVETERRLPADRWQHVFVTYDGSRLARGVTIYVDGRPEKLKSPLDDRNQDFKTNQPLRIGWGGGPVENRFHGLLADVRLSRGCLSAQDVASLATTEPVHVLAARPVQERT